MIKNCLICGKEFKTTNNLILKGYGKFCSHSCFIVAAKRGDYPKRGYQKGHKQFNTGKTHFKKGIVPKTHFKKGNIPWNKNKEFTQILGDKHPNWKGGRFFHHNRCFIISKNHPFKDCHGYVRRSRLVAEKCLNRYLSSIEVVHHINKNTLDDNPENLFVFSNDRLHRKYHNSKNKPILKSNLPHHT